MNFDRRTGEAFDTLIDKHGTDNQRGRYREGLLPEEEALALVRNVLFWPFRECRRYERIEPRECRHGDGCEGPDIRTAVEETTELDHDGYERLSTLRTRLTSHSADAILGWDGAAITPRIHILWCENCDGKAVQRFSAKIDITWCGRVFTREYQL